MTEKVFAFKQALGNYPTGVTVVTALNSANEPIGLTVNSFASVSIDPLLILWSLDKRSKLHADFLAAKNFAVNILASEQAQVCTLFASKEDRFAQAKWSTSTLNLPILSDTLSVLQCEAFKQVDAGDHTIFIGHVVDIDNNDKEPLLYHRRQTGPIPTSFYNK
ncbi:flavin reductase family protein [Lysinibacillus sp. NPDC096418]|uniref:flavin reductase family protein n=1 Tax=Lysinibacillus sp. NPDC096418 TaxID=3364138 RepID=UPI00382283A8